LSPHAANASALAAQSHETMASALRLIGAMVPETDSDCHAGARARLEHEYEVISYA
jgi:hypothetical protein